MVKETYSIKELEVLSDIKASTIRMWEKRYKLFNPARTDTNIRLYIQDDLLKLLYIVFLQNCGYKFSKTSILNSNQLEELYKTELIKSESGSSYKLDLLFKIIEKDIEGFELLYDRILGKMLASEFITIVLAPLCEKIKHLSLIRKTDPYYEDYILNRIFVKTLIAGERERKNRRAVREILIFQSDKKTIPVNLGLVYFLAAVKNYKVHYYFNQINPDIISTMKGRIQPDIVYTEFNEQVSDSKLHSYFYLLEETFPASKNIVSGKKMSNSWKIIPNKVYYIRNLEVLNQSL